eukprot:15442404-Alexandrium_andersonii.AAC.1
MRASAVGDAGLEEETQTVALLRQAMKDHATRLPTTMSPFADAVPHSTWFFAPDRGHRIGYVAVSEAWLPVVSHAFRPEQLELTVDRLGHLPVALQLDLPASGGASWRQRKKP